LAVFEPKGIKQPRRARVINTVLSYRLINYSLVYRISKIEPDDYMATRFSFKSTESQVRREEELS
jgi:hypothetical protein